MMYSRSHPNNTQKTAKDAKKITSRLTITPANMKCIILTIVTITLAIATVNASGNTSKANSTIGVPIAKTSPAKAEGTKSKSSDDAQQQIDPQGTDQSSMYVQIPIAETNDAFGHSDGSQQPVQSSLSESEAQSVERSPESQSKASSWTGPWPKKFQIGYIKQSDLHQVLIDSLKGDSFVSIGAQQAKAQTKSDTNSAGSSLTTPAPTKYTAAFKGISSSTPSDSSSLMSSSPAKQLPTPPQWTSNQNQAFAQQPQASTRPMNSNYYRRPSQREPQNQAYQMPTFQNQMQDYNFQQQVNFNSLQAPRPFINQAHHRGPRMMPIVGEAYNRPKSSMFLQNNNQQQQVFQFPEIAMKHQPKYTISNFGPMQQHNLDTNPMSMIMQQPSGFPMGQTQAQQQISPLGRAPKSAEYYSSWRPVTSDKGDSGKTSNQNQQQSSFASDSQTTNEGFDDGFNMPSKVESSTTSMNRHPALDGYLNVNDGSTGKLSPAMISAKMMQTKQKQGSTKTTQSSTKTSFPTKSGSDQTKGSKDSMDATKTRNSGDGSTETTTDSSSSVTDTQTTTMDSKGAQDEVGGFSTTNPITTTAASTSSTQQSVTTTTESESTTEPDSEVIDSVTTETSVSMSTTPSSSQEQTTKSGVSMTTTASSIDATSATRSSVNQQPESNGEAEVATQRSSTNEAGASLPSLNDGDSSTKPSVTSSTSASSSSRDSSGREETTPKDSGSVTTSAPVKGEVEGSGEQMAANVSVRKPADSMSDEALLAAAVRTGSEIGKTRAQTMSSQSQKTTSAKSSNGSSGSSSKKTRSSERLSQASGSNQSTSVNGNSGKKATNVNLQNGNNLQQTNAKKKSQQQQRVGKQVNIDLGTKGGSKTSPPATKESSALKTNSKKRTIQSKTSKSSPSSAKQSKPKTTRMTQQSERLQQQQMVSMTPAQAQSTAQTLASLLLSRCMQSTGCSHLLDVCTTKQANIPLNSGPELPQSTISPNASSAAWSMPIGLMSSSLMSLAQTLQADKVLRLLSQWKDTAENIVDHDTPTGYTLILPSNEAIDRLPSSTIDAWLSDSELLGRIIDAHIIDSAETIEFVGSASNRSEQQKLQSRFIRSKNLQVNQHRERMVTINGKRLIYANQQALAGGKIHVIDGIFEPLAAKPLDIMDTLKQCDKFDGFVTLAEGTGLTQILKQDGPLTVFVPSNEALRKIPDEELEVIKNNSTALREFLMYHVVNGSYFSQDLRDGQRLASILDQRTIQVGVRVDGCSRRLVEANTSPMRKADIVAKNGVIHILDWYLTVRDDEWCDPIGRSGANQLNGNSNGVSPIPPPATSSAASSSERLQQLASEQLDSGYATRISMPANHKPEPNSAINHVQFMEGSSSKQTLPGLTIHDTNNIVINASPIGVADSLRLLV